MALKMTIRELMVNYSWLKYKHIVCHVKSIILVSQGNLEYQESSLGKNKN